MRAKGRSPERAGAGATAIVRGSRRAARVGATAIVRGSRGMRAEGRGAVGVGAGLVALGLLGGCFLGNVPVDACESDSVCVAAFGLGSECSDGFCTEPGACSTGHDCRKKFGGGACVAEQCVDALPPDPNGYCAVAEPAKLAGRGLTGAGSPLVVGGIFRLEDTSDSPASKGAMLAVREINAVSGLNEGRELAMVTCDVGGPMGSLTGEERKARVIANIDYLGGTLGVPFIVGPTTSSDSGPAIGRLLEQRLPTVLISPSATSPQLAIEPDRLDAQDPYGLFWRTAPNDELQGAALATGVVGEYPDPDPTLKKVAVIYVDNQYGSGLANVFKTSWEKSGGKAALVPYSTPGDFVALAASAANESPHALMLIAVDALDAVSLVRESLAIPALQTVPVYVTDGSKDASRLLDSALEPAVKNAMFARLFGTGPATPTGPAYDFFAAALKKGFGVDPSGFAFVANAYDAAYIGAMGVVYASRKGTAFDGRDVAEGLSRLVLGSEMVTIGANSWAAAKSALTTGVERVDVVGISGELDFDVALGEAPAPIEVWHPSQSQALCKGAAPCLASIAVLP